MIEQKVANLIQGFGILLLIWGFMTYVLISTVRDNEKIIKTLKNRNEYLELEILKIRNDYQTGFMNWQLEQIRVQEEKQKIKDSLYNVYYGK